MLFYVLRTCWPPCPVENGHGVAWGEGIKHGSCETSLDAVAPIQELPTREVGARERSRTIPSFRSIGVTGERMMSFTNQGKTQGKGGSRPWSLNRNMWEMIELEGGGAGVLVGSRVDPASGAPPVHRQRLPGTHIADTMVTQRHLRDHPGREFKETHEISRRGAWSHHSLAHHSTLGN